MTDLLSTPIEYLKGVGPQRAATLQTELGIFSFRDILNHFPFRYQDRSVFHEIRDIHLVDNYLQLKGKITYIGEVGTGRHRKLTARFEDHSGTVDLIWFQGIQWVKANLRVGETYLLFGKPKAYNQQWTIPHPELTKWGEQSTELGLQAMYPSTEKLNVKGLNAKGIGKIIQGLLPQIRNQIPEVLPHYLTEELHLISKEQAYFSIHAPKNEVEYKQARYRLKFEELFFLQLELLLRKEIRAKKMKGFIFSELGNLFNTFYTKHLPFELTNAQKRVLKEIRKDFLHGEHMNRLLQGDVGSGKTLVALLTLLMGIDNGFQGALMAPTEILATQHYESLRELVDGLPIEIALLTGSTKKARRVEIHEGLQNGTIHLLIGTHALLEDVVQFANLGIVVIDEQHRFGVAQRSKMWGKNAVPPHVLIMTATPIPRTLAMTFYGDLDVSIIDELPPGRKPIQTIHRRENHRPKLLQFIKEQISLGRQIYIVYPLIQESEKLDFKNLQEGYDLITDAFPSPSYEVSMVHGKLKPAEKDAEMQRFVKAETQIMVATTVIEVGVNVPNASVMVIESAERFGLSQLHQLRGRVGRGAEKSYCILMTGDKLSKESMKRMDTMVMTNDGFQISEVDLQLRGPGDLMGTQQSGVLNLKLADLSRDGQIVSLAREKAREILEKDPDLLLAENIRLNQRMHQVLKSRPNWGRIA
ncbi:MAG: ATP-dependent DNA helicase RecG [Crocinitomicaceae bacterium]|nr:ATP-dependent DNA helicase RecG [Crocinitomicaceae bacterium]MBP6033099.1 ATP-dependent DNA helicase RecG [Crocinitomicaceae bacterium]